MAYIKNNGITRNSKQKEHIVSFQRTIAGSRQVAPVWGQEVPNSSQVPNYYVDIVRWTVLSDVISCRASMQFT